MPSHQRRTGIITPAVLLCLSLISNSITQELISGWCMCMCMWRCSVFSHVSFLHQNQVKLRASVCCWPRQAGLWCSHVAPGSSLCQVINRSFYVCTKSLVLDGCCHHLALSPGPQQHAVRLQLSSDAWLTATLSHWSASSVKLPSRRIICLRRKSTASSILTLSYKR